MSSKRWLFLFGVLLACGGTEAPPASDAGGTDGGSTRDAASPGTDAAVDGGSVTPDAGPSECLCEAGTSMSCNALAALYADDGATATCRADCSGFDVSTCTADRSGMRAEVVYPALRDPRFANARCNDGTPFDFRVSITTSSRWIIQFEGGGACDGVLIPCAPRLAANPGLFSSEADPADRAMARIGGGTGSIVSRNATANPTFYDSNVVVANYCSSDLWTGRRTEALAGDIPFDLFFAGRLNAVAMLETLRQRFGLADDATVEIIVTGSSAGGNGARNNADLFADAFPNAHAANRVMLITLAGFQIYDWRDHPGAGVGGSDLPDPEAFDLAHERFAAGLNARCLAIAAAEGIGPGACFTGLYATRSLIEPPPTGYGMRVFDATNRTDPVYLNYHSIAPSRPDYDALLDDWEAQVTSEMLASGVRWLLAPANRAPPNLHGFTEVWTTPLPPYDAASDPCASARPPSIRTYRDLVDAFYAETDPTAPGVKVCLADGWPE